MRLNEKTPATVYMREVDGRTRNGGRSCRNLADDPPANSDYSREVRENQHRR